MPGPSIIVYLNPWKLRRQKEQQRFQALRQRDGDNCRRCRRPMRFDLPDGHDEGARIEAIERESAADTAIENLCLTHRRCNRSGADHTADAAERIRRRNEAELLSRPRKRAGARG